MLSLSPITKNIKLCIITNEEINFFENDSTDLLYSTRNSEILRTDSFVFTVYNHTKSNIHVTGVKKFEDIERCMSFLLQKTNIKIDDIECYRVNNTTSVFQLSKKINLTRLKKCLSEDFDSSQMWSRLEKFPAVYFKNEHGTAVIFQSGKINLVGCKSVVEQIKLRVKVLDILCMNSFL